MPQPSGNVPEQDEFESAFAALAAEKTPAADPQAAPASEPAEPADTGAAPEATAEPATPQPATEVKPEPSVAELDLAARLQEIEQRARSSEGRLSAFSRQAQDSPASWRRWRPTPL